MAIVNLDAILHAAPKSRVLLIGVELEGGWTKRPSRDVEIVHDGSVTIPEASREAVSVGEIPSRPLCPTELAAWMRQCWPQYHNETCGMHFHMSFKRVHLYNILMADVSYQDTMVHYLRRWALAQVAAGLLPERHAIFERLSGQNRFCTLEFFPMEQALATGKLSRRNDRPGHRYTAINFCFTKTNTVECRVLPMLPTVDLAISAIQEGIAITNAFLVIRSQRFKVIDHIVANGEEIREEIIECV